MMTRTSIRRFRILSITVTVVAAVICGLVVAGHPIQLSFQTVMVGMAGGLLVIMVPVLLSDVLGSRLDDSVAAGAGVIAGLTLSVAIGLLFGAVYGGASVAASVAMVGLLATITA